MYVLIYASASRPNLPYMEDFALSGTTLQRLAYGKLNIKLIHAYEMKTLIG